MKKKKAKMEMSEGRRSTSRDGLLGKKGTPPSGAKVGGKAAIKRSTVKPNHSKAPNRGASRAMNAGNDY